MTRQLTLQNAYHANSSNVKSLANFTEMDSASMKRAQMEALLIQACSDFEGRVRELDTRLAEVQSPTSLKLLRQFKVISLCALKAAKRSEVFPFPFLGQDMETMGNAYADIMKIVVNDYTSIEDRDMSEIRILLATLVGSLNNQNVVEVHKHNHELSHGANESRALWDQMGVSRQDLILKSLHILGLDGYIDIAGQYRYVPRKVIKSYGLWRSQNASWMKAQEWLTPKLKTESSPIIQMHVPPATSSPVLQPALREESKNGHSPFSVENGSSNSVFQDIPSRPRKKEWVFDDKKIEKPNRIGNRYKMRAAIPPVAPVVKDPLAGIDWNELERLTAADVPDSTPQLTADPFVPSAKKEADAGNFDELVALPEVLAQNKGEVSTLPPGMVIDSGHDHHSDDEPRSGYAGTFSAAAHKSYYKPHQKGALLYEHLKEDERVKHVHYQPGLVNSSEPYPLSILDILLHSGDAARIVLRNFTNFVTFIDRHPPEFMKGDPLDVDNMRDRMDVWTVRYKNDELFCSKIDHFLHTPVDTLPHQVKRDLSWPGHGMDALMSLRDYVLEHHCLPSPDDTLPILHGPLSYKTTWCGMSGMLRRGNVEELKGIKSIPALYQRAKEHFPALESVTLFPRHQIHKLAL